MARYKLRANGAAGRVEFRERLTIDAALAKAEQLRGAHFTHITIINLQTGVEITDIEALLASRESDQTRGV